MAQKAQRDKLKDKLKIGIIGASGYTGADLVRLALRHPNIELTALAANTHAGKALGEVFPHLGHYRLPRLEKAEDIDWSGIDAVFCGLPHGAAQDVIKELPDALRVVDMSADFRLRDSKTYQQWYGRSHDAPELQAGAVYGLTEHYRGEIAPAQLVACPGCYPTAALLVLLPVVKAGLVRADALIIDAKSGVSGAGRGLKQASLFCEAGEGVSPYGVAKHRHAPEIEQEVSRAAGVETVVNFTPHLVPMSRGELVTVYAELKDGAGVEDLRNAFQQAYGDEPFVQLAAPGEMPGTQQVRGSNNCVIAVFEDRLPGRAILLGAIDNLVKGSAGQALQNLNVMFGFDEVTGLEQAALFP